jgi:hypothetical protein
LVGADRKVPTSAFCIASSSFSRDRKPRLEDVPVANLKMDLDTDDEILKALADGKSMN